MGIRIHKVLGYGLTDVKTNGYKINDERFIGDRVPDKIWEFSFKEFLTWFEKNKDECLSVLGDFNRTTDGGEGYLLRCALADLNEEKESKICDNPVVYDSEYGLKNVFLITPIELGECYRYDNLIDYYEAGKVRNKVKVLESNCGIYPYLGMIRKPDRGAPPTEPALPMRLSPADYNILTGRWDKRKPPTATGALLDHLLNDYRPSIPDSIILIAYRYGIFKNWKETLCDLKPMIYTYWS